MTLSDSFIRFIFKYCNAEIIYFVLILTKHGYGNQIFKFFFKLLLLFKIFFVRSWRLLKLTKTYWQTFSLKYRCLYFRQTDEMCHAVDAVNVTSTEAEINQLAGRHLDQQSLMHAQWNSQVDAIKEAQRRHYRQWLMDKQTIASTPVSVSL